jgi:hypothetical protein
MLDLGGIPLLPNHKSSPPFPSRIDRQVAGRLLHAIFDPWKAYISTICGYSFFNPQILGRYLTPVLNRSLSEDPATTTIDPYSQI